MSGVSRRRRVLRPLHRSDSPWDESVIEAVKSRTAIAGRCLQSSCRTCCRCATHGRALAAAVALKNNKNLRRSTEPTLESAQDTAIDAALGFDCLLELRSGQLGVLDLPSQTVRIGCVLQSLRRMTDLRIHRLLDLIVTNKLATEAEQRSDWYVSAPELQHLLFVAGAQDLGKEQVGRLHKVLDANHSGRLHLTELRAGVLALLAEAARRVLVASQVVMVHKAEAKHLQTDQYAVEVQEEIHPEKITKSVSFEEESSGMGSGYSTVSMYRRSEAQYFEENEV